MSIIRYIPVRPFEPAALEAVARLNSWVRSKSYRDLAWLGGARLTRAIYFYKSEILRSGLADRDNVGLNLRYIRTTVTCRDCEGTGRYTDRGGYEFFHCRACNSSGKVTLRFYETSFSCGITFHTPDLKAPGELTRAMFKRYDIAADDWEKYIKLGRAAEAVDYQPNQEGKDLDLADATRNLNAVEAWYFADMFPRDYKIEEGFYFESGYHDSDYFYYKLPLGRLSKNCAFCGISNEQDRQRNSRGLVSRLYDHHKIAFAWYRTCDPCKAIWQDATPPNVESLMQGEAVRMWLGKRAHWTVEPREHGLSGEAMSS